MFWYYSLGTHYIPLQIIQYPGETINMSPGTWRCSISHGCSTSLSVKYIDQSTAYKWLQVCLTHDSGLCIGNIDLKGSWDKILPLHADLRDSALRPRPNDGLIALLQAEPEREGKNLDGWFWVRTHQQQWVESKFSKWVAVIFLPQPMCNPFDQV